MTNHNQWNICIPQMLYFRYLISFGFIFNKVYQLKADFEIEEMFKNIEEKKYLRWRGERKPK